MLYFTLLRISLAYSVVNMDLSYMELFFLSFSRLQENVLVSKPRQGNVSFLGRPWHWWVVAAERGLVQPLVICFRG